MQLSALILLLVKRTLFGVLRGLTPVLGLVVLVTVLGGSLDKAMLLVALMTLVFGYASVPFLIGKGRTDGVLDYISGLPVSRRNAGTACVVVSGFLAALFCAVGMVCAYRALPGVGVHLPVQVFSAAYPIVAMLGLLSSTVVLPLYARLPPVVAGLMPTYILVVAYFLNRHFNILAHLRRFAHAIAAVSPNDPRVLVMLIASWSVLMVVGWGWIDVIGRALRLAPPPVAGAEAIIEECP